MADFSSSLAIDLEWLNGSSWPGRAKEDARLLAEKLPFADLRDGKFRQHPQWPVLAEGVQNLSEFVSEYAVAPHITNESVQVMHLGVQVNAITHPCARNDRAYWHSHRKRAAVPRPQFAGRN